MENWNEFSRSYTQKEIELLKSGPISLEAAKKKFPDAKIYDILKSDDPRYALGNGFSRKKSANEIREEILYVLDDFVLGYVNLNYYRFSERLFSSFTPFLTFFWYAQEISDKRVEEQHPHYFCEVFNRFIRKSLRIVENIRNSIASVYPGKTYTYVPDLPLTPLEYTCIKNLIPNRIFAGKADAVYNERKMVSRIRVEIDLDYSGEEFNKRALDIFSSKKKPSAASTIPFEYFANLPEKGKIDQEIPITVLQKNFPQKYDLLLTLFRYVNSLKWLYKISETTTGLTGNSDVNEIHILLIELSSVILNQTNRVIKGRTYHSAYFYGLEFATESKFLAYLDAIIPYQTICIFKLNEDERYPLYQIWTGKKSITLKGSKVKKYVHTDWMSNDKLLENPLEFNGNSLSEVFSNFVKNIAYCDVNNKPQKQESAIAGTQTAIKEVPNDTVKNDSIDPSPCYKYYKKDLLAYARIAQKLREALLEHFQENSYEFIVAKHYYPELLENFKKIRARVYPVNKEITNNFSRISAVHKYPTVYEVELEACRELSESLNKYYDFTMTNESITFVKKAGVVFSKAELAAAISLFFRLPKKNEQKFHKKKKKN